MQVHKEAMVGLQILEVALMEGVDPTIPFLKVAWFWASTPMHATSHAMTPLPMDEDKAARKLHAIHAVFLIKRQIIAWLIPLISLNFSVLWLRCMFPHTQSCVEDQPHFSLQRC
jgi:hypothetical protein